MLNRCKHTQAKQKLQAIAAPTCHSGLGHQLQGVHKINNAFVEKFICHSHEHAMSSATSTPADDLGSDAHKVHTRMPPHEMASPALPLHT